MRVRKDIVVGPTGGDEVLRRQDLFPDPFSMSKWTGPKVGGRVKFVKVRGKLTPTRSRDRAFGISAAGGVGGSNGG